MIRYMIHRFIVIYQCDVICGRFFIKTVLNLLSYVYKIIELNVIIDMNYDI